VAVLAVALAVLVFGRPRPVVGVRLLGGPTTGAHALSFRIEVAERLVDLERPLAARRVVVTAQRGASVEWRGTLDAEGAAAVALPLPAADGDISVRVALEGSAVVGEGRIALAPDVWSRGAKRRGGWVERRFDGGWLLRAAAERGVFAVPFQSGLWVEAEHDGNFVAAEAHGDGADVASPPSVPARQRLLVTPREHAPIVELRPRESKDIVLDVSLAVVPGALFAELAGKDLVVRSPVVHDRAYVAIVSERERLWGGTVALVPDSLGGARGVATQVPLPPEEPLWAVVSSEPDLRSASAVGWPIRYALDGEPPRTFDVADALLLDTTRDAVAREIERERRVRWLAALIALVALGATAAAVVARAREAQAHLSAHMHDAGADRDDTARVVTTGSASVWLVVAAVLSVALGALLVALFAVGWSVRP
jgi:hypothetical protein